MGIKSKNHKLPLNKDLKKLPKWPVPLPKLKVSRASMLALIGVLKFRELHL